MPHRTVTVPITSTAAVATSRPWYRQYGIVAIVVLVLDVPWCWFFEWPFGYPKQFDVGFVAWLWAGTLALAEACSEYRNGYVSTMAGLLFAADLVVLSCFLPTY